jgi:hypothetical protein
MLGKNREAQDELLDRAKTFPVERRNAVRYQLHIPVVFSWDDPGGERMRAEGNTRDISEVSVFIWSEACPAIGDSVEIQVMLSAHAGTPSTSLKGTMQVTRVENEPQSVRGSGFALSGKAFTLRNSVQ